MVAAANLSQRLRTLSQMRDGISEIWNGPDHTDPESAGERAFAQPCIDQRRFPTWIGADQETGIGLLDTLDGSVKQVSRARSSAETGAVLATIRASKPRY